MWINPIQNKYYVKYVTLATRVLFLIYLLREMEKHWFVVLLIYASTGWFFMCPGWGWNPKPWFSIGMLFQPTGEGIYKSFNDKIQDITEMILFSQFLYILCEIIINLILIQFNYSYKWSHKYTKKNGKLHSLTCQSFPYRTCINANKKSNMLSNKPHKKARESSKKVHK